MEVKYGAHVTTTCQDIDAAHIAHGIERWFQANARALPWRIERSAWKALVSEIMLQQTQASRVAERFDAVMQEFPTPRAMADAPIDVLLAHWQGLGYYRRARSLHASACMIVQDFNGKTPTDSDALQKLPGVGRYTAGSIASIVGGHREPIVDGNVRRVLSRIWADDGVTGDADLEARTWDRATELVQACCDPGSCNEGLMEFGATVCTPRNPGCDACPLATACRANASRAAESIPRPRKRLERPVEYVHALLLMRGDNVLLEQRPEGGRWAGMWQPVSHVHTAALGARAVGTVFDVGGVRSAGGFDHNLTHRQLKVRVFRATAPSGMRLASSTRRWVHRDAPGVALSSLGRKILSVMAGVI